MIPEVRAKVYAMTDDELGRAVALFFNCRPELRSKLILDDYELRFAETMRERPVQDLTWKQRRFARAMVERNAWVLAELAERAKSPDEL